ncbi:NYN domain-containing protein [Trametes meyenii]|nr:NYN domain-containing protein [Trametes meyenii]
MTVKDAEFDEHVAIFWDYENCTPPCSVPGYDVVNNIRQVAHEYGSVKLFKAYLELSEQSSSKSIGLRSELQSCGVSLTDCPHNGRKDVADKMMIVDMLTYAIDNPAPATIVLISGDRDFVYAVSVLRLRRYRVVVVAPNTAHGSLRSQASTVLDWEAEIMRRTGLRPLAPEAVYPAPYEDIQHRSPRRPPLTLGGSLPQTTPKSHRRPSFKATTSAEVGIDGSNLPASIHAQGRHMGTASAVMYDGSNRGERPSTTQRSVYYRGAGRPQAIPTLGGDREDEEIAIFRPPIPDLVDMIEDLQEHMSRDSRPVSRLETPGIANAYPFRAESTENANAARSASQHRTATAPRRLPEAERTVSPAGEEDAASPSASNAMIPKLYPGAALSSSVHASLPECPATIEPISRVPSDLSTFSVPSSPFEGSDGSSVPPPGAFVGTSSPAPAPKSDTPGAIPNGPALPTVFDFAVKSQVEPTALPTQAAIDPYTEKVGLVVEAAAPVTVEVTTVVASEAPAVQTSSPPTISEKFKHLVAVLQALEEEGTYIPLRTTVAVRLLQVSKKIYEQAGTASFKEYSSAAEKAGVVILGGSLGHTWIQLSPEYRSVLDDAPAAGDS